MIEKIQPSSPFKKFADIERVANLALGKVSKIQIDVCDGEYVKNISWPFTEYSKDDFAYLSKRISKNEVKELDIFLPHWEDMDYSVDLMCLYPEKYIDSFVSYGVNEVILHFRSIFKDDKNEDKKYIEAVIEKCRDFDLKLVLAVDVKSDLKDFINYIKEYFGGEGEYLEGVQVMGIENIGVSGQSFDEKSLEMVTKIKKVFPKMLVQFDGGVNDETVESVKESGVDIFCVGSFLVGENNFADALKYLKKIV